MATLDNTGDGPLQVPGFGSIPLHFELSPEARFAHGLVEYRHSPRLTMREMAMLRLMQHITEQPGWDRVVLDWDGPQLAQWYRDAREGSEGFLISPAVWNWCLAELRDKAETWQRTGRLFVFDSSSAVCQAEASGFLEGIQEGMARLGAQPSHDHPLVDPSLFPLVYDRSPVLVHGGQVSLDDLWGLAGEVAERLPPHPLDLAGRPRRGPVARMPVYGGGPESCWSNRFQWLPCEVQFSPTKTPNDPPDVQITSYVNNLHPDNHRGLYRHLERLISDSISSWNEILFYGNSRGRHPPRILTYGCQIHNYMERHKIFQDLLPMLSWNALCDSHEEWQELRQAAREYITGPEPPKWKQANPMTGTPANLLDELMPDQWDIPRDVHHLLKCKRIRRAWFDHPEPGVSFTYDQWKRGQFTGRALSPQRLEKFPDPLHHDYTPVHLQETFRQDGLQVVVEINRIELTPDNPTYSGEAHYHTEGLRNDHIAATSLYVVEAKNVTQARMAFEHEDKVHAGELECKVPQALATVLDVDDWEVFEERPPRALHTFGSVPITEGRLLSWPNTYRSKQESFGLVDSSQPGHLTLIKLRLVDPHYRICSTRNVPPQQHDWWAAAARQAANLDRHLPPELVLSVMEHADWWPISAAEAQLLREDLCQEHERVRNAIEECVGHHVVVFLPYDQYVATDVTDTTGVGYESP
ncbi:DUF4246 domain-containing protein [Aspergillus ibericus CBS 121593]|uniref:Uncharacterized protein n=1 Tax=Aspergillus ibericus CBS 121593 TaxID=1448316 RepID=A0A395GRW8_9EURO|nr:hypothetical protein BO80DRAFT_467274 [Aspergillus ibericus CBS 121593]RAK98179.1 hypothetical protein BO80DRAFT_467274 [Aspergillus ibericus CBS 121593]